MACKCAFYRPEEMNFEGLEMQKWIIPADRTQRIDEKNGVVCLVIMFTPWVTVLLCHTWLIFCIFCFMAAKYLSLWANYLSASEGFYEFLQKMPWLIGFGVTINQTLKVEISKKLLSQQKILKILCFQGLACCLWQLNSQ